MAHSNSEPGGIPDHGEHHNDYHENVVDLDVDTDKTNGRRKFMVAGGITIGTSGYLMHRRQADTASDLASTLGREAGPDADPVAGRDQLDSLIAQLNDPRVQEDFQVFLTEFEGLDPERYQDLMRQLNAKPKEGAGWVDYAGVAVFSHGIKQITDESMGHVGAGPYSELALLWMIKYLQGDHHTKEHLITELKVNSALITAILVLVTLGENTGFDIKNFIDKVDESLNSDKNQVRRVDILERGKTVQRYLSEYATYLSANIDQQDNPANFLSQSVDQFMPSVEAKDRSDVKRALEYFVKKELKVALNLATIQAKEQAGEGSFDEKAFAIEWLKENGSIITDQMAARFTDGEKIRDTIKFGAGGMVFSSATSPVATTVAAAVINKKAGIGPELAGPSGVGVTNELLKKSKWTDIPPFEIRIQALLEDHVSNLSGLGGVGDPPFLAMAMKFGIPGFFTQWAVSFPSTLYNAELSYASILGEYYPYLSHGERHKIATAHMATMVPTYISLFGANACNTLGALLEGAAFLGGEVLGLVSERLKIKDRIEEHTGVPAAQWRFRSGIQYSWIDMAKEAWDEFQFTEKPSQASLKQYFATLQDRITEKVGGEIVAAQGDGAIDDGTADAAGEVPTPNLSEQIRTQLDESDRAHLQQLQTKMTAVNTVLDELWSEEYHTQPCLDGINLDAEINRVQDLRKDTHDPKEQHELTTKLHNLIASRDKVKKTPKGKADYKANVAKFSAKRDEAKSVLGEIEAIAPLIGDETLRRQVLHFIRTVKMKIAKLELSQLGFFNLAHGSEVGGHLRRLQSSFDMEHMVAVLGHARAEVANVLPFQASCVPFLTPVFKDALKLIPKENKLLYVIILFTALNLFSSGADNLVAALVGLEIEPELWPYVMQASIDGGKNSRIGNMANLAGCSMEDFPLKVSFSAYLLSKRLGKAGVNFGYALIIDKLSNWLGFKLTPLGQDQAEAMEKEMAYKTGKEQSLFANANPEEAIKVSRSMFFKWFTDPNVKAEVRNQSVAGFKSTTPEGIWEEFLERRSVAMANNALAA